MIPAATVALICERVALNESLATIVAELGDPDVTLLTLKHDRAFANAYADAKRKQRELVADPDLKAKFEAAAWRRKVLETRAVAPELSDAEFIAVLKRANAELHPPPVDPGPPVDHGPPADTPGGTP